MHPCSVIFSAESRAANAKLRHHQHDEYSNNQLSPEVEEFINNRVLKNTSAEIVRQMRDMEVPECNNVAEHQVYYRWSNANSRVWQRDNDPITSAFTLLKEAQKTDHCVLHAKNAGGVVFLIPELINCLSGAKEIAIDETYGTNNSGMGLFAVLATEDQVEETVNDQDETSAGCKYTGNAHEGNRRERER